MANSMAYKAALMVPNTSGVRLNLGSNSLLDAEDCQTNWGVS